MDITKMYMLMAWQKNEEQCFIYEFYPYGIIYGMDPNFTGYYSINIPSGLDENSCFASSALYNGIIFYSSGNTIYRLDFKKKGGTGACDLFPSGRESS